MCSVSFSFHLQSFVHFFRSLPVCTLACFASIFIMKPVSVIICVWFVSVYTKTPAGTRLYHHLCMCICISLSVSLLFYRVLPLNSSNLVLSESVFVLFAFSLVLFVFSQLSSVLAMQYWENKSRTRAKMQKTTTREREKNGKKKPTKRLKACYIVHGQFIHIACDKRLTGVLQSNWKQNTQIRLNFE